MQRLILSAQILFISASMDGCRLFRYVVLWSVVVGIQNRQCPDGFYGSRCQHECPVTCNNKQCKFDEVGRTSCIDGCVDGYRGTSCRIPCPGNCQVCERVNGSCINCKDTFHGTNCTLTCEELCQGFRCDTDQTCSKTTCLDGRYGQNCSTKCYPRYLTCSRSTGGCTACRDGYYGQFCEHDCPRCGFTDGSLDQTCKDGCNTTSCSDITGGDSAKNIWLTVFGPVVLLLVIVIAVILWLWRRSYNKIMKKKVREEEVQQRMLNEHNKRDVSNAEVTSKEDIFGFSLVESGSDKTLEAPVLYSDVTHSSIDDGFNSRTTSKYTAPVLYSDVTHSSIDDGFNSGTTSQYTAPVLYSDVTHSSIDDGFNSRTTSQYTL